MLNKYGLKEMLYKTYDEMDKQAAKITSPGCADEQTGRLRSEAYTAMREAAEKLKQIADSIY